ncbi:MAG: LL-diaminopimelate aminotransferase, partial [Christensenellaceae bacterium]|nr:LL-diaminopimelate aminotransferase [Christensenellaceae bacterium]
MFHINDQFEKLPGSYLFAEIARRIKVYQEENPAADLIRLGIGDVTKPLVPAVIEAMHKAVDEMGTAEGFRGYGPDYGYDFLVNAIRESDYAARGVDIAYDEVFISDGAKCDVGNIQELFSPDAVIAVTDPVYPVYVDSNAMAGRAGNYVGDRWDRLVYLPCNAENGFVPPLPDRPVDVIYLCYPNNPTGTVLTKAQLKAFVDWAKDNGAIIIYDAAYKAYITTPDIPLSIYEVEGAKDVAIECCSYSKTAGFTGTRCAYTVVPHAVKGLNEKGENVELNGLWKRRMSTKFNGVSYPIQRAAAAIYTPEGQAQIKEVVASYMENARIIRQGLTEAGFTVFGGQDAPYIWLKTPDGMPSWTFFDRLLKECNVVGTPGAGFGPSGEGYFRLTAFNTKEKTEQAMARIKAWKW